jgi:hypothetical protein
MVKLSRLNFFQIRRSPQKIELRRYINFYLDTIGWYAPGHHQDKAFLAIVEQQEPFHTPSYEIRRVWAKQTGEELRELKYFRPHAKPITIIEFYS